MKKRIAMLLALALILSFAVPTMADSVRIKEGSNPNVRSKPSTEGEIVEHARSGQTYELLDTSDNWYKIKMSDGTVGWISGGMVDEVIRGETKSEAQPAAAPASQQPAAVSAVPAASTLSVWVNKNAAPIPMDSQDGISVLFDHATTYDGNSIALSFKIDGGAKHMKVEMLNPTVGGRAYTPIYGTDLHHYLNSENGNAVMSIVNPDLLPVEFSLKIGASLYSGKRDYTIGPFRIDFEGNFTAAGEEIAPLKLASLQQGERIRVIDQDQIKVYLISMEDAPSRYDEKANTYVMNFLVENGTDTAIMLSMPSSKVNGKIAGGFNYLSTNAHDKGTIRFTLESYSEDTLPPIAEAESITFDLTVQGSGVGDLLHAGPFEVDTASDASHEAVSLTLPGLGELEEPLVMMDENGVRVELLAMDMITYDTPMLNLTMNISNQSEEAFTMIVLKPTVNGKTVTALVDQPANIAPGTDEVYTAMLYSRRDPIPADDTLQEVLFSLQAYLPEEEKNLCFAGPIQLTLSK